MQWPENVLPGSLASFETQARQKRYRLLAQAAMRTGIRNLFLGHHKDDQVETILLRLLRGKSGSLASFYGIAAEAPIPADAEVDDELLRSQGLAAEVDDELLISQDLAAEDSSPSSIESEMDAGPGKAPGSPTTSPIPMNSLDGRISLAQRLNVSLHRPLLKFSKARILATCKANSIPFVTDPTNFDPQTTVRNAVRYLLANYRVPRALSRDSILKFHDRALKQLRHVDSEVRRLLDMAQLVSFDLRSGSLTLRLPHLLGWENSATPISFLARILRLVSPIDSYQVSKSSQKTAASFVFHSTFPLLNGSPASASIGTVAVNQVLMTREHEENLPDQQYYVSWRLSRQPFKREEMHRLSQIFIYQPRPENEAADEFWSDWMFWDGRYWIRVCCSSVHYLQNCAIRPFQPSDATYLRATLDRESRETLTTLLHDAAPGKIRYTLPVITDDVGVRAFPTLDFCIPPQERERIRNKQSKPELISWKVKYKYIDRETIDRLSAREPSTDQYRAGSEIHLKDVRCHPKVD